MTAASRVVDPRHDVGDAVVLPGDPGGEDVRVVAVRHGDETACQARPRRVQVLEAESGTDDRLAPPGVGEPVEGLRLPVDDGDRVALLGEADSEPGTHPPTADDDDVHRHHATPPGDGEQLPSGGNPTASRHGKAAPKKIPAQSEAGASASFGPARSS